MRRLAMPREFWIPKGAVKVADKTSDAVAYLYTDSGGRPCAKLFSGKRDKPDASHYYRSPAERERDVSRHFTARRAALGRTLERREERKAAPLGLAVGDIVNTCWGYDQTNREFFEVIEARGKMVTLREVAQVSIRTGHDYGRAVPQSGKFIGEPIRRRAHNGQVRIDDVRHASKWNTATVAGVPVGPAVSWSDGH